MNPSTSLAAVVIDELIRCGLREVVISPGSRSAPLAMEFFRRAELGDLRLSVRIDERSTAFLGRLHTNLTTMSLDDPTYDREAQSCSLSFRRNEWLEYAVGECRRNARPGVANHYRDLSDVMHLGADHNLTRGPGQIADGIDRVEEQVEHDLLELHAIALYGSDAAVEIERQLHLTDHKVAPDESRHVRHDVIDRERLEHGIVAPHHRARAPDHVRGPHHGLEDVGDDPIEEIVIGRIAENAARGRRCRQDRRERLIQLMRDGRRELAKGRKTLHVREIVTMQLAALTLAVMSAAAPSTCVPRPPLTCARAMVVVIQRMDPSTWRTR